MLTRSQPSWVGRAHGLAGSCAGDVRAWADEVVFVWQLSRSACQIKVTFLVKDVRFHPLLMF